MSQGWRRLFSEPTTRLRGRACSRVWDRLDADERKSAAYTGRPHQKTAEVHCCRGQVEITAQRLGPTDAISKRHIIFTTDIGVLDLLGEVRGVGFYEDVLAGSTMYKLFGYQFPVIDIGKLIAAKRTAGRPKDLIVIPELEAIQERLKIEPSE